MYIYTYTILHQTKTVQYEIYSVICGATSSNVISPCTNLQEYNSDGRATLHRPIHQTARLAPFHPLSSPNLYASNPHPRPHLPDSLPRRIPPPLRHHLILFLYRQHFYSVLYVPLLTCRRRRHRPPEPTERSSRRSFRIRRNRSAYRKRICLVFSEFGKPGRFAVAVG
jgi:hypothetical protein